MTQHRHGLFRNGNRWCSAAELKRLERESRAGDLEADKAYIRAMFRCGKKPRLKGVVLKQRYDKRVSWISPRGDYKSLIEPLREVRPTWPRSYSRGVYGDYAEIQVAITNTARYARDWTVVEPCQKKGKGPIRAWVSPTPTWSERDITPETWKKRRYDMELVMEYLRLSGWDAKYENKYRETIELTKRP